MARRFREREDLADLAELESESTDDKTVINSILDCYFYPRLAK